MWFNFSFSAILITYFVVKMAHALQENIKTLSRMREDELRNQQLMAVAMLAAGAAHEMNTPLSTMTILLSELQDEHKDNSSLMNDIDILKQQVKHCANTLKNLVHDSNDANEGKFKQQPIYVFCNSITNRWQLMRPNVNFSFNITDVENQTITQDPRLDQAIINLLNNAADASLENVNIAVYCNKDQLVWQIIDSGKGISDQLESKLGKIMLSTKEQGLGIGLLLAHATIKHYGGTLSQIPNKPSGTITELRLPLAQ
jgi:two-component system sensor histidine kinase RegB